MIYSVNCTALSVALEQLKKIIAVNEGAGRRTVIFCEDRLSLAAERTVCAAVGGTFSTSVYTFSRFLSSERGKMENVLSSQGSAMAVRKIIEDNKNSLNLFKKLSAAGAAQSVYDTIALLYSSRVTADEAAEASKRGGLLGGKLHDLALIYKEYGKFLKDSGKKDRNEYLRMLPEVIEESPKIKGGNVVFLGFQAFTCSAAEGVRAAFGVAENVYGLFIGGKEEVYVNEAAATFTGIAAEFGGAKVSSAGKGEDDAEILRRALYDADAFHRPATPSENVNVYEATDSEEEFEFIAAEIKKHVSEGERYAKISVMLPDLEGCEHSLARVFARYKIPYYADRQYSLAEHSLCAFVLNYILCTVTGCDMKEVDAIVASPYFPAERKDKDIFRNYLLKFANYRGGVKRKPREESLKKSNFDIEAVERVRGAFLKGLEFLPAKGGISDICGGVRNLLKHFDVEKNLSDLAAAYRDARPAAAQFSSRAHGGVISVLDEAESISGGTVSVKDFLKILKSGFAAMKISLIPPKADAVFVGDLAKTANTGSNVVFAARLTGDVPDVSSDTSLLTDREISALEEVNLNISPKISRVNARKRETCALNICAFRHKLYLSYAAGEGGEEKGASELVAYASAVFATKSGRAKEPIPIRKVETLLRAVPYYCSEELPAIKYFRKYAHTAVAPSIYKVLEDAGLKKEADAALKLPVKRNISCGQRLYTRNNSLSPTALETYFSCPYLGFVRQGLKVKEREEGVMRPADTGNFIHAVLEDLSREANSISSAQEFAARAEEAAREKLSKPPFSSLADSKSGKYVSGELIREAVEISEGMYAQLKNSSFKLTNTECGCEVRLPDIKIYGRIDRVDESGDMVRIIDYKTGRVDASAAKYYTGAKLQLPLYLLSVSKNKRAAGAYYFPASIEYRDKKDGVFRLQGFMDGSDDVVTASDNTVKPKVKSEYVNAYLGGGRSESAMSQADFYDFLKYSELVAGTGAKEMLSGNIRPSPAEGVCAYCKAGGSCGANPAKLGEERKTKAVKCSQIAEIVRRERRDKDETDD